jgi:hypothetical protein
VAAGEAAGEARRVGDLVSPPNADPRP